MVCIGLFSQVLKEVKVPLGFARVQLFKLFPVWLKQLSEAYLGPCQWSMVERFSKVIKGF